MWIGTRNGLNRYDGTEFVWFTTQENGLASNEVHGILEDANGWLWLPAYDGPYYNTHVQAISILNPSTGEVRKLKEYLGQDIPFEHTDIYHIHQARNGELLIGTTDGRLIRFKGNGKPLMVQKVSGPVFIQPGWCSEQGSVFITSTNDEEVYTLLEIDVAGKTRVLRDNITWLEFVAYQQGKGVTVYESPLEDEGPLQLQHLVPREPAATTKLNSIALKGGWHRDDWRFQLFKQSTAGWIWGKSLKRLFAVDPKTGFVADLSESHQGLIKSGIQHMSFDHAGGAWLATAEGLYRVSLKKNPFETWLYNDPEKHRIEEFNSCRGIALLDSSIYVGTAYSGLWRIHPSTGLTQQVEPPVGTQTEYTAFQIARYKALLAQNDTLLAASFLLSTFHFATKQYHNIFPADGSAHPIWCLHVARNGTRWLGGTGIRYHNRKTNRLELFNQFNGHTLPPQATVYHFLEIDDSNTLIATSAGIFRMTPKSGMVQRYWTQGKGQSYFPYDNVFHLYQDAEGIIWAATDGGGLIKWDYHSSNKTPRFEQFTVANGLSNNTLYAVYEDKHSQLWLPSDYGLIQFDKYSYHSTSYLEKDGVSHHEFNRASHFQGPDGRLYFGTLNGLNAFHPSHMAKTVTANHPLVVTSFLQFDGQQNELVDRTAELNTTSGIELHPGDDFFTLKFALLDYEESEHIHYSYRLEGQDKDWQHIKTNHLRFSGLNYGEYVLHIRGQSANGQFSQQALHLPIQVFRPFYLEWWFILFALLAIMGVWLYAARYRVKQLKKRQVVLEETVKQRTETIELQADELRSLDEAKSRFFANVSHELRTPLTLMKGPLSSLRKRGMLPEEEARLAALAEENTNTLSTLVDELLNISKLEAGNLELKETTVVLSQLVQRVAAAFESYAHANAIALQLELRVDAQLTVKLDVPKLEKVINNLLSNAFKFTEAGGGITLLVSDSPTQLNIQVSDTGRGIHPDDIPYIFNRFFQTGQKNAPAEGGTGIGLALCNEYCHAMNGHIQVDSVLGQGSTFTVSLPKKEVLGASGIDTPTEPSTPELENGIEPAIKNPAPISGAKLLVVEDNASLRQYIEQLLAEKYQVTLATNGKEAWALLNEGESRFDLILSDIMMPQMDGYQLLEAIKASDAHRHLPVIMLTARAGSEDRLKALRMGIDDYMLKPFEEEELLARVHNLISNRAERTRFLAENTAEQTATDVQVSKETAPISEPVLSAYDEQWLEKLESVVARQSRHSNFNVEFLAGEMAVSRQHATRRIKQLTGLTAIQYIQEARMNRGRKMLEEGECHSVKAVALEVGIQDTKYFSRQFKARFGKSPSDYLQG